MNSLPTENCDYNDVLYLVKSELEKFKSTTLSSLESRFISAIEKCNKNEYLDEITDMCSKMLKLTESHNNVFKNFKMQTEHTDLEKDEKIKDLEIENAVLRQDKGTVKIGDEEMRRKVESLTKERNELQDSNDALRKREQELLLASQKKDYEKTCLEEDDYKYKLRIETQKLRSNITSLNEKISSLENVIELKKQTLDNYRERAADLESRSGSLEKSLNSAKDEIITLKTHIGSMSSKDDWCPQEGTASTDGFNNQLRGKPKVLLVGTSNIKDIEPTRFTPKVYLKKEVKYTVVEAKEYIEQSDTKYDAVAFHVLTNDIKGKDTESCITAFSDLIETTQSNFFDTKMIISTETNRTDSNKVNLKVNSINAQIRVKYHENSRVFLSDNENMSVNGQIREKLISED